MRRISVLFVALAISITGLSATPASAAPDGSLNCGGGGTFTIQSDVVVSSSSDCSGAVTIPNGVTEVGWAVFWQRAITSVSLPSTLVTIADHAFRQTSMTSVYIPGSVQTIGYLSFGTTFLESIAFGSPSSLTSIGNEAFQSSRFISITIPATVTSISATAFDLNIHLTSINFLGAEPAGRPWSAPSSITVSPGYSCTTGSFAIINNVVTNGSTCAGTANIPSGVTAIGEGAFQYSSLTAITLPSGVTEIRNYAFYYATSLSSINLPTSVTAIGEGAFINTTSLASLTLPENLASLGNQAFRMSGLTSVSIPSGITTIGEEVFLGAASLATVNLPNTLTSIGSEAFRNASSLSSITLPNSLTTIGPNAFLGNTQLTAISFPSSVTSIGTSAFQGTQLVSITIPSSVTTIANNTFQGITSLTSLTLPSTLTSIGDGAFYDASALASVTIPAAVSSIGEYAFGNTTALTSVTFLGNEPNTVHPDVFTMYGSNTRTNAARVYIAIGATGFASPGSTWSGLTVEQSTDGTYSCSSGSPSNATPNFTLTSGVVTQGQACTGDVVIPSAATSIGANAFSQGTSITSIEIPETITTITAGSLGGLSALVSINVAANNANFSSTAGVLLNKLGTSLIKYPAGKTATSYSVSRFVTSISSGAFDGPSTLASVYFDGDAPASVGASAFSGLAVGARAVIDPTATGFASIGSTWNGLTVASSVISPPSNGGGSGSSTSSPIPTQQPLPKVSGVQIASGKSAKSSTVKLQLTGVKPGASDQDIQIRIFDTKGNLFKTLTVPIDGVAGSLEVALPLALGEFTVEANTIGAAGAATELVRASSPIIRRSFHASPSSSRSPVLFGEAFARPITFAANSSVLTVRDRKALLLVAAELRKTRSSLAITGFTSRSGASRSFDRNLSSSRALSVARFLKAQGLSNILYVAGYGSINNSRSADSTRKVELRIIN